MHVYIAGPMTGRVDLNKPAFVAVEMRLKDSGYEVLNPARIDEVFPKDCGHCPGRDPDCQPCLERTWHWYMRKCIPMVLAADGLCALRGWSESRGARLEVEIATSLGIPVASPDTWALRNKALMKEWGRAKSKEENIQFRKDWDARVQRLSIDNRHG